MKFSLLPLITCLSTLLFISTAQSQLAGSGNAYDFNSNYISIPNNASLNSSVITLEAWIKADSWGTNIWENVIISKDGWAAGEQGYTLRAGANGSLSFNIGPVAAPWQEVTTGPLMALGQWYHVAGSYDGTTMRIFINGEEINTFSYTGAIDVSTYEVTIGRISYTAGGSRYFDGMIDEVKIWNSAIPQSTLQDYMCKKVTAAHPQYASLVGYWNMDASGTVVDASPNANDGTNFGAVQMASGAAIGDESIHTYTSPVDLTLPWMGTDSLQVVSSSAINTVHVYRVDDAPMNTAADPSITAMNPTHYYGVFAGGSNYSLDVTYHYEINALGGGQYLNLAGRTDGTVTPWMPQNAILTQPTLTLDQTYTSRQELILAVSCPQVNVNLSGAQSICLGDTLTLVDQSSATTQWYWHDANGPIPGETWPSMDVTTSGDYYLVGNDGACADTSATINVTVNTLPTVSFGALATQHCENDQDMVIPAGTPAGGGYSGTGILAGSFSPSTAGVGTYTLYYNYADLSTGCSNTDSLTVDVYAAPSTPVITANGGDLCISSAGAGATYEWFVDGNPIAGATDTCYTPTANGDYSVVVTSTEGCTASSSNVTIDNIGLEEDFLASIQITPNPTNGVIYVTLPANGKEVHWTLVNANGQVLMNTRTSNAKFEVDLEQFGNGIYYLTFETQTDHFVHKVVKH